ncbi:hypothetical protein SAAL107622_02855 [Lacicoccus alkaliphilus]|uniref:Uncharacterized protein n=1 Tax=Lacicoccus alkaliphilus DSM 16010 TaxID=1123231 RepID=A0A1M7EKA2_9BACL|nr:hypothetical protein SAMN02745189_01251 [Salinicoccus alkaliphilus DSM 16010]
MTTAADDHLLRLFFDFDCFRANNTNLHLDSSTFGDILMNSDGTVLIFTFQVDPSISLGYPNK